MPQTNQNKVGILLPNDSTPVYDSLWASGNRGVSNLIASFDFNGADTIQTVKNGVLFESGARPAEFPPSETEKGIPFLFAGNGNEPNNWIINEIRYQIPELDEVWIHQRFFVPTNYKHRSIVQITVDGDISTWQRGDSLLAPTFSSTAIIYGIQGSTVYLEFAQNGYSSVWTTSSLQNTTRSQTRNSTYNQFWGANNKLFAIWCDGYSTAGQNSSIAFEQQSLDGIHSTAYFHYSVDNNVAGSQIAEFDDFITAEQIGKWIDIFYGFKLATAIGTSDGIVEMWIKREGETNYVRKINERTLPIWKRAGNTAGLQAGYLHGSQNSGYEFDTTLYDSKFELYDAKPSFLV